MRTIVLFAALLLSSVAGASEWRYEYNVPPDITVTVDTRTACEHQLREALIAIKPYLSFNWGETVVTTTEYCPERCQIERQLEALDRREKVQAQYRAALKECGAR